MTSKTDKPNVIDYFSTKHPLRGLTTPIAYKARQRMFDFFMQTVAINSETKVIDIGVTPDRSLSDSNFFEAFYPYKNRITATSIEDAAFLEEMYPGLRFMQTNGKELPFEDKSFDIAVSFAVLEHVGDLEKQRNFINEVLRVAKFFFLTTPNKGFPVEVHTFLPLIHWLPQPIHQKLLKTLGLSFWASTDNLNLLTATQLLKLFPPETEVQLHKHHLLGLTSNLIVYGNSSQLALDDNKNL